MAMTQEDVVQTVVSSDNSNFPILALPRELRENIYAMYMYDESREQSSDDARDLTRVPVSLQTFERMILC